MKTVELAYSAFLTLVNNKNLLVQYSETSDRYFLFAIEHSISWEANIVKPSDDATDFETNHKSTANKPIEIRDAEGKVYVRSESRQIDKTTYFTCRADNTGVGDGKELVWDFSNTDDDVTPPTGYLQKKMVFSFSSGIQLKDGTLYWMNAIKGSYLDVYIYHPVLQQNISHYVVGHRMIGDCPMGDELNTETASEEIPAGVQFHVYVTVPDVSGADSFYGHISIEANRVETI